MYVTAIRRVIGWALALSVFVLVQPAASQDFWESEIVYTGADGGLVYEWDEEGNRIPNFSRAGYHGGGVSLPDVPTVVTVSPSDGDDTENIQAAVDEVGARTPDANGFRGAVELTAGTFRVDGTVEVTHSGVVLRGAGDGEDPETNTILHRSGTSQAPVVRFGRNQSASGDSFYRRDMSRNHANLADERIPVGARSFNVDMPEHFDVGDDVVIYHPAHRNWISAIDGGGTAGDPRWGVNEQNIAYVRTVESIDGTLITVDAPVYYELSKERSPFIHIYHRQTSYVIEEVGLESLRVFIETASPTSEDHAREAIVFTLVENAWAQSVTALHFWKAGISIQRSRYVTVLNSQALAPHSIVHGGRRYNFDVTEGQLILFEGNRATFARHSFIGNGESIDSGIVFYNNISENAFTSSEAHRKWGTGFLFDNHIETGLSNDRRIHIGNRGSYGTAHGWACANCVVWNADMGGSTVVVEKPPTAQNYAIGVSGVVTQRGPFTNNTGAYIEGANSDGLSPQSLYLRQLEDRQQNVSAQTPDLPAGFKLHPAAPNPTSDTSRIRFELGDPAHVRMTLYDVLGREVGVIADDRYGVGVHTTHVRTADLASGVYVYRLTLEGHGASAATGSLVVVK